MRRAAPQVLTSHRTAAHVLLRAEIEAAAQEVFGTVAHTLTGTGDLPAAGAPSREAAGGWMSGRVDVQKVAALFDGRRTQSLSSGRTASRPGSVAIVCGPPGQSARGCLPSEKCALACRALSRHRLIQSIQRSCVHSPALKCSHGTHCEPPSQASTTLCNEPQERQDSCR